MMADQVRAGIVGTGFIAGARPRSSSGRGGGHGGGVDAVGQSRPPSGSGRAAAETAEALIDADDVDIVHICTPNRSHLPLARRALAAGKHVICEKPLATRLRRRRIADGRAERLCGNRPVRVPLLPLGA